MTDYRLLSPKAALVVLTLLTAVFRIHALFANSFHADEALFASWARLIAVWRDPLLQTVAVDKPPLLFYAQALFFPLLGPVEWAARLPNLIASILLVPLVAVWVWRWYRDGKTAVFAAALVALSPLHIQFSATAFTDPLLTTLLVGALLVSGRPTKNKKQKIMLLRGRFACNKFPACFLGWLLLPSTRRGCFCRWWWERPFFPAGGGANGDVG
ncbi:MAG: glycosyltransferase family 39 protein [Anaerolineales bacterium]|nr:glycosyltransferase family 39 protein [Anaerolineales bacterium]